MRPIAALYVQPSGVYANLSGVDCWDEERDARLYPSPHPVVAHPPCARWSRLAGFCEKRWGLMRGDDGGCFEAALEAVQRFGGVLEHPAHSAAWAEFGLPEPHRAGGWQAGICGGWSCYVEQGRYGHPAKKATWLYASGVELPELRWGFTSDHDSDYATRWWNQSPDRTRDDRPRLSLEERRGTPIEFRDVLIGMARSAKEQAPAVESPGL